MCKETIFNRNLGHENVFSCRSKKNSRPAYKRRQYRQRGAAHEKESTPFYSFSGLNKEIAAISVPALASLAADPIAGLVDTAYIGKLGAIEVAAVGIALSVFGTVARLFNVPLLAVTTSLVATAEGCSTLNDRQKTGEASTAALLIAVIAGCSQAILLLSLGGPILGVWGAQQGSELRGEALAFLQIRATGAPVTVLLLVLQGVFRGIGDTRTPFAATVSANAINILLDPIFIFVLGLGAPGAALATVLGQGAAFSWLMIKLNQQLELSIAPDQAFIKAAGFIGPTGLLAVRSVAISGSFAAATSLAARTDTAHAAGHQICLQLWLASSLLADSLAVAAQSIMARNLAANNKKDAVLVAKQVTKLGAGLGMTTGALLAASSGSLPHLFTSDDSILQAVAAIFPWVAASQPITALAFVADGVLYGASGFRYAAWATAACCLPAVGCMSLASMAAGQPSLQMTAIWSGLTLLMLLRTLAIYLPFRFSMPPFRSLFESDSVLDMTKLK